MIVVALTGGMGSGKSTVSSALAQHGAVVIDADAITREVQAAGQPVLAAIVERFGDVLTADGELDRGALAATVFGDADELAALNKIVHPAVNAEIVRQMAEQAESDRVVILDIPLLIESGKYRARGVLVVDTPIELAVERLVAHRGISAHDAHARIARQATREQRLAKADFVIDNSTGRDALLPQIEAAWQWMSALEHGLPDVADEPAPATDVGADPTAGAITQVSTLSNNSSVQ
jgi:dephospho-CoA kinase